MEDVSDVQESIMEKLVAKAEEDTDFPSRLLTNPSSAWKETLDIELPDDFNVVVHEDDALTVHLVLPALQSGQTHNSNKQHGDRIATSGSSQVDKFFDRLGT